MPDPLAEKYDQWSPYNYVLNNPSLLTDKDGTEPDRNRAGTINHAVSQWNNLDNQSVGGILNYIQNNPESVRYIYTEGNGWVDLQHYFGSLSYGEGAMDMLETASGNKFMQNHFFGVGANESYFSYEDLPSNDFASDSKHSLMSISNSGPSPTLEFKKGEALISSIGGAFKNVNATNPKSAPNWTKIPFKDHTRSRLPKGISKAEAMKLLKTGNYVLQNKKDKPLDLTNFSAASTSIEEEDERVGVTGH